MNGQVIGTPVAGVTVPQRSYCQYRDAGAVCVGSHVDSSLLRPAPGVIMESWIAWLVLAALLGAAEVLTTTLAFGLLAVAALVAAIAGGAGLGLPIQLGAFAVTAGAGLGVVRPLAVRHLRRPPLLRSGASALVGRPATVVEEVTAAGGRVRIGGEVWSARCYDESQVIPAGSAVDVFAIEGATALVHPRE